MDQSDLVESIGDALTLLDKRLMSGDPPSDSPEWQQLYARRIHLDDQQRDLVRQTFEEDDETYKQVAPKLVSATKQLEQEIDADQKVDQIIGIVAEISSDVDQLLKAAP